jgi:hypothetical protein
MRRAVSSVTALGRRQGLGERSDESDSPGMAMRPITSSLKQTHMPPGRRTNLSALIRPQGVHLRLELLEPLLDLPDTIG